MKLTDLYLLFLIPKKSIFYFFKLKMNQIFLFKKLFLSHPKFVSWTDSPMLPAYFSVSFWKKIQSKKSLQLKRKGTTWVSTFCLLMCTLKWVTRENKFGVTHKWCRFNWWGGPISSATVVRLQQYLLESRVSIL